MSQTTGHDMDAAASDAYSRKLEAFWGEGYMSPGGDAEVDAVVGELSLHGKTVLDIGCGLGGPSCRLVERHGAARVTAYDIDAAVLDRARAHIAKRGLAQRIEVALGGGGEAKLPFASRSFDAVFSKDAFIHVDDKPALYAEVLRVLKPGGWLAASDWYGTVEPPTPEMQAYVADGRGFRLQPLDVASKALAAVGFTEIKNLDRAEWFLAETRGELARLDDARRAELAALLGAEAAEAWIARTRLRETVAAQGQLRPGHVHARKPV